MIFTQEIHNALRASRDIDPNIPPGESAERIRVIDNIVKIAKDSYPNMFVSKEEESVRLKLKDAEIKLRKLNNPKGN